MAAALGPTLPADIRIVASALRRARQTALAIAEAAGQVDALVVDDRWREVDFGVAEGRTFDELASTQPALAGRLAAGETAIDWPGGERAEAFAKRIEAAWRDLAASARPTVLVSHAGPLRLALAMARGLPATDVELFEPASFVRLSPPLPPA